LGFNTLKMNGLLGVGYYFLHFGYHALHHALDAGL
jgi:hypothetical protein